MQRGRSPISLGDLLASGLLHPGDQLSFRNRPGTTAELTAAGKLKIGDGEYSSPGLLRGLTLRKTQFSANF